MREHVKADEPFERSELPAAEAIERFRAEGQDYKVELIEDLVRDQRVDTVSLYRNGPFVDLCRGPHAPSTKRIEAFKLTSVAGAYWRGDSERQMLTRVYGTAFLSKADLEEHLRRLEEARARDHRELGPRARPVHVLRGVAGHALLAAERHPRLERADRLWREENVSRGYTEVRTPILYDVELWKQSGHWDKFRDHMYFTEVEDRPMGLKPMNCPAHIQIYKRGAALLPRPADPLRRAGPRPPPRAERHAARASPRALDHPGRRPRVLHRGADRGRGDPLPRVRLPHLRPLRVRAATAAVHAPRQADRHATRCGTGPRTRWPARWRRGTSSTGWTRARAPSTGRRSTCT